MNDLPFCRRCMPSGVDPFEERLKEISAKGGSHKRPETILLVVPPSPQKPTPGREFLITGPFEGFTCIASLVKKMGFNLKVIDCRMREDSLRLVVEGAREAEAVGIAAYCDSFIFLQEITRILKETYPEKLLFLGGPLVTSLPEILLKNTSADCAVLGEAELTLIELLEGYFSGEKIILGGIKGLAYKENGMVFLNEPRSQIANLDNLPMPDYTIWPNYGSIVANGQILISSMRGCPQECSFCFKTIPGLRLKSLRRFAQEVAYLKRTTGFDYTWLNDLTFNVIEPRAIEICSILKQERVKYHCFARVQNAGKLLAETLRESGCLGIWFGIESYSQDILDINRKNIRIEEINRAVDTACAAGLAVRGLFIVGLPGETEASLRSMLEFISTKGFLPLAKYLVPFPGTSLFDHALRTGKISDIPGFLKMLSCRKVGDCDDEIVNLTSLQEGILRRYFHDIWKITKKREGRFEEKSGAEGNSRSF